MKQEVSTAAFFTLQKGEVCSSHRGVVCITLRGAVSKTQREAA